ncbi:hypothetical protein INR49_012658 [Caranx melampygus]|nr:hypothetical protein INR49_012658 [Caranx melampygus]
MTAPFGGLSRSWSSPTSLRQMEEAEACALRVTGAAAALRGRGHTEECVVLSLTGATDESRLARPLLDGRTLD